MVQRAYIQGFDEPAIFGVHKNIEDFYGLQPIEEHPATLDYIAATASWLTGTFGSALDVRKGKSALDRLSADVEGDIEAVDDVLRIAKIRLTYKLRCSEDQMDAVNRAYKHHPIKCPAYMTFREAIDFSFSLKTDFD